MLTSKILIIKMIEKIHPKKIIQKSNKIIWKFLLFIKKLILEKL